MASHLERATTSVDLDMKVAKRRAYSCSEDEVYGVKRQRLHSPNTDPRARVGHPPVVEKVSGPDMHQNDVNIVMMSPTSSAGRHVDDVLSGENNIGRGLHSIMSGDLLDAIDDALTAAPSNLAHGLTPVQPVGPSLLVGGA